MNLIPIREINTNSIYFTRSRNYPVKILNTSRYGHSCNVPMVTYQILCDTADAKAGQLFTLEESIMLSKFLECEDVKYITLDFLAISEALTHFKKYIDESILEELAGSSEIYESQKRSMLPINNAQLDYIAKITVDANWYSLDVYLMLRRKRTLLDCPLNPKI
jgi:hypothetical protein